MKNCLLKLRAVLHDFNTKDVSDAADVYRSRGVEDKQANVQAVEDHLRDLRRQKSEIESTVREEWKKRDPEGYAASGKASTQVESSQGIATGRPQAENDRSVAENSTSKEPVAQTPELQLKGETEAEIKQRETLQAKADAEKKSKENAPSPEGFTLTGSDRPADVAEAHGQKPMFARAPIDRDANFKAWFGDSKVVDAEGKPLVVYHQTTKTAEQAILTGGGFSTAREFAKARASDEQVPNGIFFKSNDRDIGVGSADREQLAQMPAYLSIQNPFLAGDRDTLASHWRTLIPGYSEQETAQREIDRNYGPSFDALFNSDVRAEDEARHDAEVSALLKEWEGAGKEVASKARSLIDDYLRAEGYDGVILLRDAGSMGRATRTFIALKSEQVKSATLNDGSFDKNNPDIRFKRGANSESLPVTQVQTIADAVAKNWTNAPEIHVIASMEEAPKAVREENDAQLAQGAEGAPYAFYHDGAVYLVASEAKSVRQVVTGLFHESLGHYGLRGVFGEDLKPILSQLAASRRSDIEAKAKEYGLDMENVNDRLIAAEEVLAELAQTRPEISFVQRALAVIRGILRKAGLDIELSDAEIIKNFIEPARDFVEKGYHKSAIQGTTFHRAYHGSPHDFDRFDIHKIGTGEGAQAFGYGLYFAGKKEVAQHYRERLSGRASVPGSPTGGSQYMIRGVEFPKGRSGHAALDTALDIDGLLSYTKMGSTEIADHLRSQIEGRIERFRKADEGPGHGSASDDMRALADFYDEHVKRAIKSDIVERPKGRLYEVELAPKESDYLDYEKTYDEQSPQVKKALEKVGIFEEDYAGTAETGRSIYHKLGFGTVHDGPYGGDRAASELLAKNGIPGIKFLDGSSRGKGDGSHNYVIFDDKHVEVRAKFARDKATDAANPEWSEPSRLDNVVRALQDRHIDTKRVLQDIRKAGKEIAESVDVYLQEELYHGRAAKRTEDFLQRELTPLVTDMALRKVSMPELEEYLHARHAEEANAHIAARNPDMQDGGSGKSNAEAREYLDGLSADKKRALEALAKRVDEMTDRTRQTLVSYGLESQATINGWKDQFKYYVPLQREDMGSKPGIGQGFSVKGKASKSRTGSNKAVTDILANIAMQRERAITRGEKNRVSNALVGLAESNPNPDFWRVDEPPKIKTVNPDNTISEHVDPLYKSRDNVLIARMPDANGNIIERAVVFNEQDERATKMAAALKNLDTDQLGMVLGVSAKITRYFASINTQYNPAFGPVNIIRDVQGAMFNLSSTPIAGKQMEVMRNTISALRGIYSDLRAERSGKQADSKWAQLFEEFQQEGGQTGYRNMFGDSSERAKALQSEIERIGEGKMKQAGRAVFDWLSDYNSALENSTRLAAYKVALDAGLSKQKAASIAKNITVNFNRKGNVAAQAGALYAFFNASAQGTARLAETLAGPAGKKIVMGGIMLGGMQALLLAAAGFDDKEPPEFVKERSLVIPIGDKKYITVPMPQGLLLFPNMGRIATEYVLSGFKDAGKRGANMMGVVMDAFNPIGNAGMSLQTIAPTAIDPLAALAENKDWTGKPIARADSDSTKPTPGFTRAKDTATAFSKWTSQMINWATGGTNYKPGAFSPTPDQIDYLIGQASGGVGRELGKVEQGASALYTGEDVPEHKYPMVGRFYGNADSESSHAARFYDNAKEVNLHKAELEGRKKHGEPIGDYMTENPEARLIGMATLAERTVQTLNKRKRELVEKDAPREQIKAIEDRIQSVMRSFNERYSEATRQPA